MKRALFLLFLTAACVAGFLYAGSAPLLISGLVMLVLLAGFLYRRELRLAGRNFHRSIFAPIIEEEKRTGVLLSSKIESTEHRMSTTELALEKFATAIGDYATHLSSHTSAIQGLAEASQELKMSAAEQNRVLAYLLKNTEEPGLLWQAPPVAQKPAIEDRPPVQQAPPVVKVEPVPEKAVPVVRVHKPYQKPGIFDKPMPPGCALSRETRARKALAAQKEISHALHNLQSRLESVGGQV